VGNKSLLDRAIDAAKEARIFSKIIVSTDIEDALGRADLNEPPVYLHKRPEHLASNTAEMVDVVKDVVDNFRLKDADYLWLLQPTTPFRERNDFQQIKSLIHTKSAASVISVAPVGGSHPNRMYTIKNQLLYPLSRTNFGNRQALAPVYLRNGAFYVVEVGPFRRYGFFYQRPCVPYLMDEKRSVNIDSPEDLLLARAIAAGEK
jgi:CMP-N-acetylneuraminic acid synthetase